MTTPPEPVPPSVVDPDDPHLPVGAPTRTWRRVDRVTTLAFILLLVIPSLAMLAGVRSKPIENRRLFTPPPVSVEALGDPEWFAALDRAVGDNVAGRPLAVGARARAIAALGGSPNPGVVRGTGDWLFAAEELLPDCSAATAGETIARLGDARAAFEATGQEFRFVLAPDKHSVYPDKRRPGDGLGESCSETRRPEVSAGLDGMSWAVNGWELLAAERAAEPDGEPLFYPGDTHWTPAGALPTIRALIQSLDPELWSEDEVAIGPDKPRSVDLARLVGIPRKERTPRITLRPGMTVTREKLSVDVRLENAAAILRFTSSGDRSVLPGRTVVVYDSFYGMLMPMVAPYFEETVWIHHGDLRAHPELAAELGPFDRVVLERVERGLYLQDVEAMLAPLVRVP